MVALCAAGLALPGAAAEIDSDTTEAISTSTAEDGGPGDIVITDDGEIDISGQEGVTAVSIDSDNDVTNDGAIIAEDTDDVTAIRILGQRSGDIVSSGTINLTEDYDREDEDDDDDDDGPLAVGTGRTAILLDSGSSLTGNIVLESGASIVVEGNQSAGLVLLGALDGSLHQDGSISVTGDDAQGIVLQEGASGDVLLGAGVSARGKNAAGVVISGEVGGTLTVEGAINATGFTSTGQTNYVSPLNTTEDTPIVSERLDEDDLYDNQVAMHVGGSVDGGLLINGAVDDFVSEEDEDDETKDTLDDFDENRTAGSIISYGTGTALEITPDTPGQDQVLQPIVEEVRDTLDDDDDDDTDEILAEFQLDQGLINRGSIAANGLNIGFAATALDIYGRTDGTAGVEITGGILNTGTIQATAYEADALAVRFGSGTDVGTLENTGTIGATIYTRTDHAATGLLIEDGSTLASLDNSGTITVVSNGYGGQLTGIRDESDTLRTIENTGIISATLVSDGRADDETGRAVAIDLSAQTLGAVITQFEGTPVEDVNGDDEIDEDDVTDPYILGDVLFGSGDDVFNLLGGSMAGDTDFGEGDAVFTIRSTSVTGDTVFSGDSFALSVSNSDVEGDVSFGTTSGQVSFSNGSTYSGNMISDGGGSIDLLVSGSDIELLEETSLSLTSLGVSGDSIFSVVIDAQAARTSPYVTVAGAASFGSETTIRPVLTSIVAEDFTTTLVSAGDLSFEGELSEVAADNLPWVYNVSLLTAGEDDNDLVLDFRLKTAEELKLDVNQASALDAVMEVAVADDDIGEALAGITEEQPFLVAYNLLLPQRTDASTRFLESQQNAAFGALNNHLDTVRHTPPGNAAFWLQETFSTLEADATEASPGYNGRGISLAAGADMRLASIDAVGLMVTMNDGRFEEKTGGANPVTTNSLGLGAYASDRLGPIDIQLAGQYSDIDFSSYRRVYIDDYMSEVSGDWDGSSTAASARVSTELGGGLLRIAPFASIDYFHLDQDGYSESATNGLGLEVGSASTERVTATAGMSLAATWGWSRAGLGISQSESGRRHGSVRRGDRPDGKRQSAHPLLAADADHALQLQCLTGNSMFQPKRALPALLLALSLPGCPVHGQTANTAAETATIRSITVEGNQRVEDRTVQSYLLVQPGDPFDQDRIDLSLKTLFATGLFADAVFQRSGDALIVRVVENPIINRVIFEGNNALDDDKLREEIEVAPRGIFTAARVQSDVQRILELYRQAGRFAASVEPQYKPLEQNRVDLVFEIEEGPVTGVRAINIIGNEVYDDDRLRSEIVTRQSRWWRFFSSDDNYDPGRLEYDRELLRQFYQNKGYYDFRVVSAVAELTPDQEDFYITYTIEEGEQYVYGDLTILTELEKLNAAALHPVVGIDQGDLFNGAQIEKAIDALTYAAGVAGYAFVDITPKLEPDPETNTIDVTFTIDEGPRVYIERINIVGNTATLDRVIRRELRVSEGDAFNRVLLDRSRNRVRALGYFKNVELSERPGSHADTTIVDIAVEEQPTGELAFSAGYSSTESFLFDVNVGQRNLRGRGQGLSARLSTSALQNYIDLRFSEPRFLGRNLAAGVSVFASSTDYSETYYGGYTTETVGAGGQMGFPLSDQLQLGLRYTLQRDEIDVPGGNIVIDEDSGERATTEVTLDDNDTPADTSDDVVGVEYIDADSVLPDGTLKVDICDVRYLYRSSVCSSERAEISSIIGYSLNYDRRNDPIAPTGGYDLSFSQDMSGFGGDVNFVKSTGSATLYQGIFKDVVASLRVQGGFIEPYGSTDATNKEGATVPQGIRINNRFFRGGSSFRGFDTAGLGPRLVQRTVNEDGTTDLTRLNSLGGKAFYQATLDISVPNYLPEEYGIGTALFLEAGSVGLLDDVDIDAPIYFTDSLGYEGVQYVEDALSLRASAGLSVFWKSPFGPIQFDFAQVLRKEDYDRTESFRFSTSTRF